MDLQNDLIYARTLDANNNVSCRDRFLIPQHEGEKGIYFLGNSLGLQPNTTRPHLQNVLDTWAAVGVEGFFRGNVPWLQFHDSLAGKLSRLVGARASEVVIMNGLTVNLHLLLASFYQPKGARNKILCEAKAFPSDQYMLETHVRQRGFDPAEVIVEVAPGEGSATITEAAILSCIE
ncbi:MAG: kynureninase, partial [Chitinophagaceae bacterium]